MIATCYEDLDVVIISFIMQGFPNESSKWMEKAHSCLGNINF